MRFKVEGNTLGRKVLKQDGRTKRKLRAILLAGVMAHTCNPSSEEAEAGVSH